MSLIQSKCMYFLIWLYIIHLSKLNFISKIFVILQCISMRTKMAQNKHWSESATFEDY